MVLKIRLFTAAIVWTCFCVSCSNGICPRKNDTWYVSKKNGKDRCILNCTDGYVPSGCHVIRPIFGKGYNKPIPVCEKASYVSGTTIIAAGVGITAVVAAPLVLTWAGFGAAGVAAGSVAASIQGPATLAGSWFAMCQSAGAAGIAYTTQAVIGGAAYTTAEYVMRNFKGCEEE